MSTEKRTRGRPKKTTVDSPELAVKNSVLTTAAINTYPAQAAAKPKKKKQPILDPNYRYRVFPKQATINVSGESQLINGIKIEMYIPLVKWLAGKMAAYLPPHVDREELVSEGFCGLLEAAYKYNADKGRFETFARNRIGGSMQDWLRSIDRLPRSAREAMRKIENAEMDLSKTLNRSPTIDEIAERLNVTASSVAKRKDRLEMEHASATVGVLERPTIRDSALISEDHIDQSGPADYSNKFLDESMLETTINEIATAIHSLPEKDKLICLLSLMEGLDVTEVVDVLGTNPARVKAARDLFAKKARVKVL